MASSVDALNVELPTSANLKGAIETPIKFDPEKLKFLIAPPVEIESLCFPPRGAKHVCYEVSNSKTLKLTVKNSNWQSIGINQ